MRTSRSMSCTLSSVMRAWPRIVLTSRLRRSVRAEATSSVRKYVSTLGRMILSFGPEAGAVTPTTLALSVPSVVALACYLAAAIPGERFSRGLRAALLVGWIAQGLSLVIDVAGIGSDRPGARFGFAPALSVTLWLVLAVYELESRFVPLAGARRALATLGVVVVVLAWLFPGPGASAGRVDLGAAALAARRRLVRPVRRRRPARASPQSRRAADAARAEAAPTRPRRAFRCCASSG